MKTMVLYGLERKTKNESHIGLHNENHLGNGNEKLGFDKRISYL